MNVKEMLRFLYVRQLDFRQCSGIIRSVSLVLSVAFLEISVAGAASYLMETTPV